jgi:hypothetical protein
LDLGESGHATEEAQTEGGERDAAKGFHFVSSWAIVS